MSPFVLRRLKSEVASQLVLKQQRVRPARLLTRKPSRVSPSVLRRLKSEVASQLLLKQQRVRPARLLTQSPLV